MAAEGTVSERSPLLSLVIIRLIIAAAAFLLLSGCAGVEPLEQEEIAYSSAWFACKNRFSCVVVYDAFCKLTAVNTRSSIVYQDWSRQEVIRQGERTVCPRPERLNEIAGCVRGRCVYPFSFGGPELKSP